MVSTEGAADFLNVDLHTNVPHVPKRVTAQNLAQIKDKNPPHRPQQDRQDRVHSSQGGTSKVPRELANPAHLLTRAPTPINVPVLVEKLRAYPNVADRNLLSEGFLYGFSLGYNGPRVPRESRCLPSASCNPENTWRKLNKEISLGRIAGPFSKRPLATLQCSPIGLIKKNQPGEYRLITHLSFPPGGSINDGIPRDLSNVSYTSFDEAVRMVQAKGKGALLAKRDIKSAFRLLPIYPADFDLLGFRFQGYYFVDKCLPMGASISCSLFEKFSTYLEYQAKELAGSDAICHYLDDFLFCSVPHTDECHHMLGSFDGMCDEIGVPRSEEKSVNWCTCLVFLGLELDTIDQCVRVPREKTIKLLSILHRALDADFMSLSNVQSLLGSLNFVCRAVSPGRAFLRRLIDLTKGVTNGKAQIKIGMGAKRDVEMWIQFLTYFNGTAMFLEKDWVSNSTLELFTDAAGSIGFGAYFQGKWTQGKWPLSVTLCRPSIAYMELFPIVIALELWGPLMANKRVKFWSDNTAVVTIINKQTSRCPMIMQLVRKFVLLSLKLNIVFKACYIEGVLNGIADSLSRFQNQRFRQLAPEADSVMTPLPRWTQT